jgi:hypothetical protein
MLEILLFSFETEIKGKISSIFPLPSSFEPNNWIVLPYSYIFSSTFPLNQTGPQKFQLFFH